MHALISRVALAVLLAGCNSGPPDSSTAHGATTEANASESSTHAHETTGAPTASTTSDATGDKHSTETGTTHAHTSEPEPGTSGGTLTPAAAYCECMIVNCHDDYHGTWGEEHEMTEASCQAEAAALPSVGMPAMQGESIECRAYYCDLAKTDPTACASAIGGGSCT